MAGAVVPLKGEDAMDKKPRSTRVVQLETLLELSGMVNSAMEISEVRQRAIEAATRLVDCEVASLLFIDEDTGGLYFDVALGDRGEAIKKVHLARGQGIAGWVADRNQPVIINDPQNDPRFFKDADKKSGFLTRNIVCVPINTKARIIGVLQAINKNGAQFSRNDQQLLTGLSNQIAVAIENVRLYDDLKESFYSVVHVLGNAIEKRDIYSAGHAKRVANYCLAMGRAMGFSKKELINLKLAAVLHDVGMIGVPDQIMHKKSKLSPEEYKTVMRHVLYSEEILKPVKLLHDIMPAIKYHHEHYNGSGYLGARGDKIPLLARVIAVADAFDAMTTDRAYRNKLGYEGALEELRKNAGSQFDPDVVNAFFHSKAFELAKATR